MALISSVFSLRHFLLVSIAINVSLVYRILNVENVVWKLQSDEGDGLKKRALPIVDENPERVINCDHGDPTMYEMFWREMGDKATVVIPGWQFMSYFSDTTNICWFLEPDFSREIRRLHEVVGNAITQGRHIVVGTGSSQLYLAALYAFSPSDTSEPISVVSAAPFYSSYPSMTDCMKSGLYKWAGDARSFSKNGSYIELVTSPNNPDGFSRQPVVNRSGGIVIHDFAYYWPQYTPILSPADHEVILFTASKSTGHAGMRIGWALVKDKDVAEKMTKFIELNSIGVSKESQLRAAKVLSVVSDTCQVMSKGKCFFELAHHVMSKRWHQLRLAVKQSVQFSLAEFPAASCRLLNRNFATQPAFAWLKCDRETDDCESLLRRYKILTRGGQHFGMNPNYVRINMLDRDVNFNLFTKRLSNISNLPPSNQQRI